MIHIFVINHFAGNSGFAKNLREHLAEKARKDDFKYFVFNTVHAGYETQIARKICKYFEGENLRFYCCGGSGTMRNMLNGLDNISNIEVAFFPCGLTNDFLKCFGDYTDFRDIDKLIDGKIEKIDYIKTNYGVAINTLSAGVDSNIEHAMRKYRVYDIFNNQLPYILAIFSGVLFAGARELSITVDGHSNAGKYMEFIMANGVVFGGNIHVCEEASIVDGEGSYFSVGNVNLLEVFIKLTRVMNKHLDKLGNKLSLGKCKKIEMKAPLGSTLYVNFDGELVECGNYLEAEIVKQGLNLVIPKTIEIKDYKLK